MRRCRGRRRPDIESDSTTAGAVVYRPTPPECAGVNVETAETADKNGGRRHGFRAPGCAPLMTLGGFGVALTLKHFLTPRLASERRTGYYYDAETVVDWVYRCAEVRGRAGG